MEENRGTILIVDDEESIRDILCRKLQSQGYNCVVAVDGKEALWKAFMQDFDLVLMDIKMPGLGGMEVLPQMVTDHADTCVIMLTAVSDIQTAVEAMKLGAYDYLTKPFNLDDLIMRAQRALERRMLILENKEYQRRLEQRVEQQAGQIRKYHSEAEGALSREQAALVELEAARQSLKEEAIIAAKGNGEAQRPAKGLAKRLSQLLSSRTSDSSNDDSDTGYLQTDEASEEAQGQSPHAQEEEA